MDRNVVIATVLIALIMVVWLTWLTPPAPPAGTALPDSLSTVTPEDSVQDDDADLPELPLTGPAAALGLVEPVSAEDSTVAGAGVGEARTITVQTDLYEATLSTQGATLVSWTLAEYLVGDGSAQVQIVDTTKAGALSMVFTSPSNRVYDTRAFFFDAGTVEDHIVVDSVSTISFTTPVGAGLLRIEYRFQRDSYEMGVEIRMVGAESFATQRGYELVWNGAIPFSEVNRENEAQRTGAFARSGGEVEQAAVTSETFEEKSLRGEVDWVAVKSKYFVAALIPDGNARGAELVAERFGEMADPDFRLDFAAGLSMPFPEEVGHRFRLYVGPMEYYRISRYDLDLYHMVDYGWDFFETVTRPLARYVLIPTFTFLGRWIPSFGLVIIIFSLLIKLLVHPLTKSSFTNMAKMRELQPRMEAIKEKYADNPQKQQEATMKMYKETGVNPLGGCLPMLLQYPIIISLWQFLPQAIEIRQQGFLWATDLSAPDVILNLPFTIPLYGDFVSGFTMAMGISMVVQMRLQASPSTNAQAKIFTYVFPVMIFVIFNKLAAGLNLYYLCYNVLSAVHQKVINRQLEAKKAAGESILDKKKKKKAVPQGAGKRGAKTAKGRKGR